MYTPSLSLKVATSEAVTGVDVEKM